MGACRGPGRPCFATGRLAVAESLQRLLSARLAGIGTWEPNELNNGIFGVAEEHEGLTICNKSLIAGVHGLLFLLKDHNATA